MGNAHALVELDLQEHFDMAPFNGLVKLKAAGDPAWTMGKNKKLGYKTKENTEGKNGFLPNKEKEEALNYFLIRPIVITCLSNKSRSWEESKSHCLAWYWSGAPSCCRELNETIQTDLVRPMKFWGNSVSNYIFIYKHGFSTWF